MFKYFLKRLAQMVVTLFIVSILVFVLANFIGDPVNMLVSPKAPPEVREQVREELGLNRPILEQYVSFITNAFKGDFGKSYIYKVDALSLIAQRVPATLELVFVSAVLALGISIPLGVYAGAFPKRKSSTLVMGGSILGISLPSFFIGIMLIYIFSLKLHWFPSSGRGATAPFLGMDFSLFAPGGLKYIILPALTLSVTNIASLVRLTRAGGDGEYAAGLYQICPSQRCVHPKGPLWTRPEKCPDPGYHGVRYGNRFPYRLYDGDGDHLLLAGTRQASY